MSKYTPEQVAQYMDHVRKNYGSKYTPDQMKQYEDHIRENYAVGSIAPGDTPDKPQEADLYDGSDLARAKASFGDDAGVAPELAARGWSETQRNKDGELVAKNKNGKYYRDAAGLTSHPLNWMEAHLGGALPLAGMALGGAGGTALGSPTGPGAVAAGAAGAGVGSGVGEAARAGIGRLLGVHKGDAASFASDVAGEAGAGMVSELGGKVINKIPVPGLGKNVGELTKEGLEKLLGYGAKGASKVSQMLTGVDADAYLRQMLRPKEMGRALEPGNALRVSKAALGELEARDALEGKLSSEARTRFAQEHGATELPTEDLVASAKNAITRNAPNAEGESGMLPGEIGELQRLAEKSFMGSRPGEDVVTSVAKPSSILDASGKPIITREEQRAPTLIPVAKKPVASLQRTADYLQNEISNADRNLGPSSSKGVSEYQNLVGKLKEKFHQLDPEGLGKADARAHDFLTKLKILGPLEKDTTGESFASSLFGANKGARQEAAQALVPGAYEEMADIGARKAMNTDPRLSKYGPSAPSILRGGVALGGGMAGMLAHGDPMQGLMGLGGGTALAMGTSPMVHRAGYNLMGRTAVPIAKLLMDHPQLAPMVVGAAATKKLKAKGKSIWAEMTDDKENK